MNIAGCLALQMGANLDAISHMTGRHCQQGGGSEPGHGPATFRPSRKASTMASTLWRIGRSRNAPSDVPKSAIQPLSSGKEERRIRLAAHPVRPEMRQRFLGDLDRRDVVEPETAGLEQQPDNDAQSEDRDEDQNG